MATGSIELVLERHCCSGGRVSEVLEIERFLWAPRGGEALSEGGRDVGRDGGLEETGGSYSGTAIREGRARVSLGLRGFLPVGGGSNFGEIGWPKTFR